MNYGKMKPVNRLITKGCHFIPINTLSLWSKTPQHHVRLRIKGRCEKSGRWLVAICWTVCPMCCNTSIWLSPQLSPCSWILTDVIYGLV